MRSDSSSPERLVVFSDGVFAIAITLLALELRVPAQAAREGAPLWPLLVAEWPKIFSLVVSFGGIGLDRNAHRRTFAWIDKADGGLVFLSLVLLMLVSFLPFPTAVLGDYGEDPTAVIFYASSVAAVGCVQTLIWLYAVRRRLVRDDITAETVRIATIRKATPLVFLPSIGLALSMPEWAMPSWPAAPLAAAILAHLALDRRA